MACASGNSSLAASGPKFASLGVPSIISNNGVLLPPASCRIHAICHCDCTALSAIFCMRAASSRAAVFFVNESLLDGATNRGSSRRSRRLSWRCQGRRRTRHAFNAVTTEEQGERAPDAPFISALRAEWSFSRLLLQATEYHLGLLKAKLAKLRTQLLEPAPGTVSKAGEGFEVSKFGATPHHHRPSLVSSGPLRRRRPTAASA